MAIWHAGARGRLALLGAVVVAVAAITATAPAAATISVAPVGTPDDLSVVGWGSGFFGELGDGTNASTSTPVFAVGIADGVVQVAAGSAFSLALTTRGEVWAWGSNFFGELGDGTTASRNTPQRVPNLSGVVAVSAGNLFALAAMADGSVKAWGLNDFGQLGVPAGGNHFTPQTVPGLSGIVSVSAGHQHSLALGADGRVWAWGHNGRGALGDGGFVDRPTPRPVVNLTGARQIAAEAAGSVALLADGSVKTWGTGCEGQLGTGQLNCQGQPVPVTALIGNVVRIAGGDLHTLAVRGDGTVWAWGFNLDRQVANDIEIRQPTPRPVVGLPGGMTQVAGAKESSVALDGSGRAWVWGRVSGNPTQVRPTPVLVPGLAGAFTISAGNVHYHALIRRPAFAIALSSTEGTIIAGGSVTTQVSLTPINGYTGGATLTVASLPAGMTATFSSPQVGPASPVTLTLATERSPAGNYQVAVTATDATANPPSQTVIYDLTITGPAERDNP